MPERNLIEQFVWEHGSQTTRMLVARFIKEAPAFPGDEALATEIGTAMGKLEAALQEVWDKMVAEKHA